MEIFGQVIGNAGVACFLIAYYLLQKARISYRSFAYLGLNLAGSLLLMGSLLIDWNLAAFVLEAAWALISIAGIVRNFWHKS